MRSLDRLRLTRLRRQLATASDRNTYVDIDRRIAYLEILEERGQSEPLPWHWLGALAILIAFFLPGWIAVALAGAGGIVIGMRLKE